MSAASPAAASGTSVISLRGISKRFRASTALDDVSLDVRSGTVHALLGENGAGKTTLMRIAFGLTTADAGDVVVTETAARITSPADAIAAGLGMVHQHFTNVPAMTVSENVVLGGRGTFDARRAASRVAEIGARAGLPLDPHALAGDLTVEAQQRLEIVKALAHDARTLILDEPTAVLVPAQASDLLRWVRAFADSGNSVVLITHKLGEALAVADEITVLRHGRIVLRTVPRDTDPRALATALLGEDLGENVSAAVRPSGDVVAMIRRGELVDHAGVTRLSDVDLELRGGEIVGLAAIEGAGQHELLRVLAGRATLTRGTLRIPDRVGFVPEDRQRDGLVLDFGLVENVALNGAGRRRGRMHWRREALRARTLIRAFDVRGGDVNQQVRTLSGGNQQKLILARELDGSPRLLVVENPTRGLDIRASQAMHERLRAAAAGGAAVVLYSSDLDEVLELATRVVVLQAGRAWERPLDREAVGRAMLGVT